MKNFTSIILLASALFFGACRTSLNKNLLSPNEFEQLMKSGREHILIDVRTPEEFAEGHINGAINADYNGGVFESNMPQWDKNQIYLVYCRSGKRSTAAAEALRKAGFTNVYELEGGYLNWTKAGKPSDSK